MQAVASVKVIQHYADAVYGVMTAPAEEAVAGVQALTQVRLLADVLNSKNLTSAQTAEQLRELARSVSALMRGAAGGTPPTLAQLLGLGITGVSELNLVTAQNAIKDTSNDGLQVDTLAELQSVINQTLLLKFTGITPDTGVDANDYVTAQLALTLRGYSSQPVGSQVRVTVTDADNVVMLQSVVTVRADGSWQQDFKAPKDGRYTMAAVILNGAGTPVGEPQKQTLVVDSSAQRDESGADDASFADKTIDITGLDNDTGYDAGDFKTSDQTLVIKGRSNAADGAHIMVSLHGQTRYVTLLNGQWTADFTDVNLPGGAFQVTAALVDAAGNAAVSSSQRLLIDTSALTLTGKTSGSLAQTANLELTFSADELRGQAGKFIRIVDENTGAVMNLSLIHISEPTRRS